MSGIANQEYDLSCVPYNDGPRWYVMRDLTRTNAKMPAYKMLEGMVSKVFTPMTWKVVKVKGKGKRVQVPFMHDLLFVYDRRKNIDPIVERIGTFQYRYLRGTYRVPMTVREADMNRFMQAVEMSDDPKYYSPNEITPAMVGRSVRIIGGPLAGYEGRLQKLQGSRTKRLLVELPGLITAAVEVQPEFIMLLK